MRYFMAGMEQHYKQISGKKCKYGLMTFYKLNQKVFETASENIDYIYIDSGAYSFQRGAGVNAGFDDYVSKYVEFIRYNDSNPKILGFFEMDIDNVVGYDKVLEYRRKLEEVSDKIIPVWHANRGINDFIEMCKKYSGKRVSITSLGEDIATEQYNLFINTAHKYGCSIHLLGLTAKAVINGLNLGLEDSFDSVSWALSSAFSNVKVNLYKDETFTFTCLGLLSGVSSPKMNIINYISHRNIQDYYDKIDNYVKINREDFV